MRVRVGTEREQFIEQDEVALEGETLEHLQEVVERRVVLVRCDLQVVRRAPLERGVVGGEEEHGEGLHGAVEPHLVRARVRVGVRVRRLGLKG